MAGFDFTPLGEPTICVNKQNALKSGRVFLVSTLRSDVRKRFGATSDDLSLLNFSILTNVDHIWNGKTQKEHGLQRDVIKFRNTECRKHHHSLIGSWYLTWTRLLETYFSQNISWNAHFFRKKLHFWGQLRQLIAISNKIKPYISNKAVRQWLFDSVWYWHDIYVEFLILLRQLKVDKRIKGVRGELL